MSYENIINSNWSEQRKFCAITQQYLADKGLTLGAIDGLLGIKSKPVLRDWAKTVKEFAGYTEDRLVVAIAQTIFKEAGCSINVVDGFSGPQTKWAFEEWQGKIVGKPVELWRDASEFPKGSSEIIRYYGNPGSNQTTITLPYQMIIAWNTKQRISTMGCHEKVADLFVKGFQKVEDHYGEMKINQLGLNLYGGCLNVRTMRGGTAMSTHSWGAAIDIDPERNQLKWKKDRAQLAKPEYEEWWKIWEDLGAVSLGRKLNYDWMHFQFIKI